MSIMTNKRKVSRKSIVERIINFTGKTYDQIVAAYEKLKLRYKMKCSLSKLRPQGADLYYGNFVVA